MGKIQRKPILTVTNRRNSENHPEFLDTEALLLRFEPLIKSIHHKFMSYNGVFLNQDDSLDLYNQIVLEFLRLRQKFDPKRGVDFTGYVKLHLQQRIYHYVMKKQKVVHNEQMVRGFISENDESLNDNESYMVSFEDEDAAQDFERAEALISIPWKKLNEEQTQIVQKIFVERVSVEEYASELHTTTRLIRQKVNSTCERLIHLHKFYNIDDSFFEWLEDFVKVLDNLDDSPEDNSAEGGNK